MPYTVKLEVENGDKLESMTIYCGPSILKLYRAINEAVCRASFDFGCGKLVVVEDQEKWMLCSTTKDGEKVRIIAL